jgi:predicted O-methyltransferase YrrM
VKIIEFLKTLPHVESNADYLNAPDYYPFLNSLARDFRAERVLEIGVRYGYSAVAFVYGNAVKEYVGIDAGFYDPAGSTHCRRNLEYLNSVQPFEFRLIDRNTQDLGELAFLGPGSFDFIHIDGDHSSEGAFTDMKNFWNVLAPGGHMLVDDSTFYGSVRTACVNFAALIDEPGYEVKSFRGTWVYLKTRERSFPITRSAVNERTAKTPIQEADIARRFEAKHAGWSGPLLLLQDGTFRGGMNSPDGRWKLEGEILTLSWYHWPENIMNSNGAGAWISLTADSLVLQEIAIAKNEEPLPHPGSAHLAVDGQ